MNRKKLENKITIGSECLNGFTDALIANNEVEVEGLGRFFKAQRKGYKTSPFGRKGRIDIQPHKHIYFKADDKLKEKIQ